MPPSKLKRPVNRSRGDEPQYIDCVVAVDTRENSHRRFAEQAKINALRGRAYDRDAWQTHCMRSGRRRCFISFTNWSAASICGVLLSAMPGELIKACGGDQFTLALQAIGGGRE